MSTVRGKGKRGLTISYARMGQTGEGQHTPEVEEAEAKREVGTNNEEVK